ncbi:MAG: hypothetical protein PWQ57_247 [Desulfovibrionales bacterium]|nr:hypothetical protein [Desulfovibrionales bacterium]
MTGKKYDSCTEYWMNPQDCTFRGEFEQMYQEIEDPWGCQAGALSLHNKMFLDILFDGCCYKNILDVGCGTGGFTKQLFERNNGGAVCGCDISATAVQKAKNLYSQIDFRQLNILDANDNEFGPFDMIICSEILWYILDGLEATYSKMVSWLTSAGKLGVHQFFPSCQNFGKCALDGLKGFDAFIASSTCLSYERKVVSYTDDGMVLLATFVKKDGK